MRRRKKKPGLARFGWILLIFLLSIAAAFLIFKLATPDTSEKPNSDVTTNQQSETSENNGTENDPQPTVDVALLTQYAAECYQDQTFDAEYVAVYDVPAGTMLFEKNAQEKITAASTTKLLTALTLLEYASADTTFTVGSELSLVGAGSSTAKLVKGQTLTLEQILDALLIPSGNDAAYVIAAHVGRNLAKDPQITDRDAVNAFLEKMNDKAKSLGADNSLFTCPDGYPDKKQYTTAEDMMKIAVASIKNETIRKTVEKTYTEIPFPDGSVKGYVNTNQLLVPSSANFYEGTFGLKTGSTPGAGQCLISGATAYGHDLIVTLFKAPTNAIRYSDSKKALDLGFEAVLKYEEATER
ncbi:MAG: D-alanyl-D-alanine carboxypeptidase [Clostridia bacterium]|nr:D-alanyl-D-alanine carboxypeptidase [Clostridia bacterium]